MPVPAPVAQQAWDATFPATVLQLAAIVCSGPGGVATTFRWAISKPAALLGDRDSDDGAKARAQAKQPG